MSVFARFFRPGFRTASRTFTSSAAPRTPSFLRQRAYGNAFRPSSQRPQPKWQRSFHSSQHHHRQAFNYRTFAATSSLLRRWAARPTFYYEIGSGTAVIVGIYIYNLEPVPVSNRYRFRIIPYDWEKWMGQQMYAQTMEEFGQKLMSSWSKEHRMVERVMERLIPHCGLEGEEWEVHVIDSDEKNAFVIPGGKVFVFRGILDIAQTDNGLAAVLGHEIAHNVAHHTAERLSQSLPVTLVLLLLPAFGIDPGIGNFVLNLAFTLPGSRKQEEEADYIGLMMMSESCFDPKAAMGLWSRMEKEEKGSPPQYMSTHPSSHNRLGKIEEWLPKAEMKLEGSDCGALTGYGEYYKRVNETWRC